MLEKIPKFDSSGVEGVEGGKQTPFNQLSEKIIDDLDKLITSLQMVTTFPEKKAASANYKSFKNDQTENWGTHQKMILQYARRVIYDSDGEEEKINAICKLNGLKDNLKMQLF